jgi:hypothetical protein
LNNPRLMAKKEAEEKALRDAVERNPEWRQKYGDAWEQIAAAYRDLPPMAKRAVFATLEPSRLGKIASTLVRYSDEVGKPNNQRYDEFRDSKLESLKFTLFSPAPVYAEMEEAILAAWLEEAQKTLGADDPFVRAALQGSTPAAVAKSVVAGTKLADVATRKALFEGGAAAIAKSDDPLIQLARRIEPVIRELRAWNEEKIQSVESSAGQRIAAARFAVYGKTVPPDANFTLRLSYGRVLGYEEDTTFVPYKTTLYGLYDRARSFDEKPPYDLPRRWQEGETKLNLATPLNFAYSADTIGGNSGSPVLNRAGEFVGINFDRNRHGLVRNFV